jgi:hypothetical protein
MEWAKWAVRLQIFQETDSDDPAWAMPIKDLVRYRAKEQQARAVAAVIDARENDMSVTRLVGKC